MARELHDVIAHHVSVISVQSGLARYVFASDPGTALGALETIAGSSHEAMAEMRRMLVLLRSGDGEGPDALTTAGCAPAPDPGLGPAPGLARLDDLVRRVGATGVQVALRTTGTPYALQAGADLCAYRVVQEALTNVLKHAPTATLVRVVVDYRPGELAVTVTDDGQRPLSDSPATRPGLGLIGMRERVTIYGGTVTAGPAPHGGFEVRLTLPVTGGR
ncbi:histidine kinase [Streptomyces sp. SMC 277]|uniref:histidine kinase n=2 Tax=Streptomyces antimicrobicus TaxID=2883108 RepID=A0ABS8BDM4_9ACTN|nr:histidine kinase [Streptomyces antimicrobicus]